jgi:hypothetical protein
VAEEGLIVQRLDDELLVYDTASDEVHCLSGGAAAEFETAADDVSRREVIRTLALAGAAVAGVSPVIRSIAAPTPAQAQSTSCGSLTCTASEFCCSANGTFACCQKAVELCVSTNNVTSCQLSGGGGGGGFSDRNLKHHLAPVASQDLLAALGL